MAKKRRTTEVHDTGGNYGEPGMVYVCPVLLSGSVDEDHFEVHIKLPDGSHGFQFGGPDGAEAQQVADLIALGTVPEKLATGYATV